ncbi:MAG: hypothetical protein R3D67_17895 [Hyphomicrobiaceae bacterium]
MKMLITAGVLCATLLFAVTISVHADEVGWVRTPNADATAR